MLAITCGSAAAQVAQPAAPAPPTMPLAPHPPPVFAPPVFAPPVQSDPPAATVTPAAIGSRTEQPARTAPSPAIAAPADPPPAAPPLVPLEPPAPPVIPPPIIVPTRQQAAAPQVEVVADAAGTATRIDGGWRITFGSGSAQLNPATAKALRDLAAALPASATLTLHAFAPGTPDDPSTARRLSLSRALVARGVLIAEGVASPRIVVRSLGASEPALSAGPPDRVDLTQSPPSQAKPAP